MSPSDHQSVFQIVHSVTRIIKVEDWQLFRKSSTMPTGEFIFSVFLVIEKIYCAVIYYELIFLYGIRKASMDHFIGYVFVV
jgi:hypothetical protein